MESDEESKSEGTFVVKEGKQEWVLIKHVKTGLVVTSKGRNKDLYMETYQPRNPCQRWKFIKNGDWYLIQNKDNQQAFDVEGAKKENGAYVLNWDVHKNTNQQWKLVHKNNKTEGNPF